MVDEDKGYERVEKISKTSRSKMQKCRLAMEFIQPHGIAADVGGTNRSLVENIERENGF